MFVKSNTPAGAAVQTLAGDYTISMAFDDSKPWWAVVRIFEGAGSDGRDVTVEAMGEDG